MSWHPSRASTEALDPVAPSRYRSAVVQCTAGRSMLVRTDDGDERLVPAPSTPADSLVGARVLLANDYDWVVAIDPADPTEAVVIDLGDGSRGVEIDLRPSAGDQEQSHDGAVSFAARLRRARRRTRPAAWRQIG
jgi:hypothetical protein